MSESDLFDALWRCDVVGVRAALRSTGANVRRNNLYTPLHDAARCSVEVSQVLLDAGADVNAREDEGWTPLMYSVLHGNLPVASFLIRAGADVGASEYDAGRSPLHLAAINGDPVGPALVDLIIEAGGDVAATDFEGMRPLHHAAITGRTLNILRLLDAGAAVDAVDQFGRTALHWAYSYGRSNCVAVLIERGADVVIPDREGNVPESLDGEEEKPGR